MGDVVPTSQNIGTSFSSAYIKTWNKPLSTAEWILERPKIDGDFLNVNLAKGNTTFSNARWSSSANGTLSNMTDTSSTEKFIMKNQAVTTTLASPGSISNGSFTVTWSNYK
ncbi:hypothetical protein [Cohnella hongkongensis]|uniref:Uncharacterized protein n=1 Tax=Cohnella hongkongensis TaxID=178337 RepID=A0ABV9FH81_9BACL